MPGGRIIAGALKSLKRIGQTLEKEKEKAQGKMRTETKILCLIGLNCDHGGTV